MTHPEYAAAVHAWAEHLIAGGREPWGADLGPAADHVGVGGPLPAAANLSLLHRINRSAGLQPAVGRLVATVALPGRGALDSPLTHPKAPTFGAPPVEPSEINDEEMVRVAVAALATLVNQHKAPVASLPDARRPVWSKRFRVHGLPTAAAVLRRALLDAGWVEGDFRAHHFVLGAGPAAAVADLWEHRLRGGAAVQWPRLWRKLMVTGVPPRLDLPRLLADASRGAHGRVSLSVGATAAEALARASAMARIETPDFAPSDPAALALRARLNQVLAISAQSGPDTSAALDALLEPVGTGGVALVVPRFAEGWAREHWRRMDTTLGVDLAESAQPGPRAVSASRVLEAAIASLRSV